MRRRKTSEAQLITYERWFAIAVGQIGVSVDEFNSFTPAEFYYTYLGWSDLEQSRLKQSWERERWAVWIATSIQLDKKDRLSMTDMFPLPWEGAQGSQSTELTMQERRERVNQILNRE